MVDGHHFARGGTTTPQLGASAVERLVLARATSSTDGLTTAAIMLEPAANSGTVPGSWRTTPRRLQDHRPSRRAAIGSVKQTSPLCFPAPWTVNPLPPVVPSCALVSHRINLEERMVPRRMRVIGAISAAAGLILLFPTPAVATPSVGVTGTVLATATIGGNDYVLREITIQPGGTTGWHWHDGTLFGYVKSGTLTHEMADCRTVERYTAGRGLREDSGADKVHRGVNIGTTPVVLDVLYVDPHGAPLSENALDPGCPALG